MDEDSMKISVRNKGVRNIGIPQDADVAYCRPLVDRFYGFSAQFAQTIYYAFNNHNGYI